MNERVLVTGGSGMLGAHIIRALLQSGFTSITATYHNHKDHIPEDLRSHVSWQPLSLPDQVAVMELVHDHDYVIHNAGFISYRQCDKDRLLRINQQGTQQIVNACLHEEVKHLIYVGSIASLGKEKDGVTLNEQSPWLDNAYSTNYGLSKYLGELEVWRGHGEGLPVSVVLPSLVIGPGPASSTGMQMIDRILHKPGFYPGGQTGFVAAHDVAAFITLLLKSNNTGERWLLSAQDMTYKALYNAIREKMQLKKTFRLAPKLFSSLYLRAAAVFSSGPMGPDLLEQTYGRFFYDGKKAASISGFRYRDIDEALGELIDTYKSYQTESST